MAVRLTMVRLRTMIAGQMLPPCLFMTIFRTHNVNSASLTGKTKTNFVLEAGRARRTAVCVCTNYFMDQRRISTNGVWNFGCLWWIVENPMCGHMLARNASTSQQWTTWTLATTQSG